MDSSFNYAPEELDRFASEPDYLLAHRRDLSDKRIEEFKAHKTDSTSHSRVNALFRESMLSRLGDSPKALEIAKWLVPNFPVGCRRLTPGPGFLEALMRENVDSHWDGIETISERGIQKKDGTLAELDAIFCATGFNTTFKPQFQLIGRKGVDMAEKWEREDPKAYFSIAVPDFPNYFCECIHKLLGIKMRCCTNVEGNCRFHRPQQPHLQRLSRPSHPNDRNLHLQMYHQTANAMHKIPRSYLLRARRLRRLHPSLAFQDCLGSTMSQLVQARDR